MNRYLRMGAAGAVLACAAGAVQADGKLSVYHWFEYIPQELLDKFSAETGIEVTMDTYDSNEAMLASLKAGSSAPTTWRFRATTWPRSWPARESSTR